MKLDNPLPAATYENEASPVSVYNAAAPVAFTDLDLSSVIGAKPALVLLRIQQLSGVAATVTIRRNGDTNTPVSGIQVSGNVGSGSFVYLLVDTDDSGIIEWRSTSAAGTHQIWIMSWLRE